MKEDQIADWRRVLATRGWLSQQTEALRETILRKGHAVSVTRGEPVYLEGDDRGGMYGIVSGGIGIQISAGRHLPRLIHIARVGRWFGAGPIMTDRPRTLSFVAVEPSTLVHIPLVDLRRLVADDAEASMRIGEISEHALELAIWGLADLSIAQSARRIAAVLLRVTADDCELPADDGCGFLLSQTMLGEMANASRNSVNKAISEFRSAGWIAGSYNHIRLTNIEALRRFAYDEDSN